MDKSQKKEIGQRIKTIRIEKKENMKDFGKHFSPEASDSIVSRWERGISIPTPERLKKIADIGNISVEYLLTGNSNDTEKYIAFRKSLQDFTKQTQNKLNLVTEKQFHQYIDSYLALNEEGKSELKNYANYLASKKDFQPVKQSNIEVEIDGVDISQREKIDCTDSRNIVKMIFLDDDIFSSNND